VALTGPIFTLATAAKDVSLVFSSDWHPGMQAFSTSGSLSIDHTLARSAGNVASPVIVIAINRSLAIRLALKDQEAAPHRVIAS
jgi:hypothetical protein